MSTAITDGKISKAYLKFDPDAIWAAEALPNATTKTTSEFEMGFDQNSVELRMEADTTVAVAAGEVLTMQVRSGSATGVYDTTTQIYSATAAGVTYEIDDLIVAFNAGEIGPYAVLDVTTDADLSGDDVNVYLRYVSR
jgi:hypothetical protein